MAIRLSGLASNMDTDSIIKELMSAQSVKLKKITDKQTKNEWIQEKWSALNTKLLNFYKNDVSKLYLQGSYKAKTVSSNNESKVVATGSTTAPDGSQSLKINQLASAQNITGGKLTSSTGATITENTKLSDLDGFGGSGDYITIKAGSKTTSLQVNGTTTVKDFVNACKNAGLNASYDTSQKRLFISSKESGADNTFSITTTAVSNDMSEKIQSYKNDIGYNSLSSSDKTSVDGAINNLLNGTDVENAKKTLNNVATKTITDQSKAAAYNYALALELQDITLYGTSLTKPDGSTDAGKELHGSAEIKEYLTEQYKASEEYTKYKDQLDADTSLSDDDKNTKLEAKAKEGMLNLYNQVVTGVKEQRATDIEATVASLGSESNNYAISSAQLEPTVISAEDKELFGLETRDKLSTLITNASTKAEGITAAGNTGASSVSPLKALGLGEITGVASISPDTGKPVSSTTDSTTGMTTVFACDSEIELNGATLTSSSNNVTANGVTYELKGVTSGDETITLTVNNNIDDTYKMVKDFITNYNTLLKEMNTLYYASSSKGYDPLSDDQKSEMSDKEVENWETKIKDSLLRRDSSLDSILTGMKSAMQSSVDVNGKRYSLSSFGICTSSDYTEKGLLHIYGDSDDSVYSSETDKLKKALEEDPDTLIKTLTGVFTNLHDTMQDKMKATTMSSTQSFYNDKEYKTLTTDYKKQVAKMQAKLQDMETSYYKKFSSMETALSKLQAQQSSLSSMLAG